MVHGIRTAWLLMVMPRSRSMSIRSRYWARALRSSTTPVSCSIRSANVDLPWSMWAMMQKFRMIAGSVLPGWGALDRDTQTLFTGTASGEQTFSHVRAAFLSGAQPREYGENAPVLVGGGMQVELRHDPGDVALDRAQVDDQVRRDGVVRAALRHQLEDL